MHDLSIKKVEHIRIHLIWTLASHENKNFNLDTRSHLSFLSLFGEWMPLVAFNKYSKMIPHFRTEI